jgi:hypothetical protein
MVEASFPRTDARLCNTLILPFHRELILGHTKTTAAPRDYAPRLSSMVPTRAQLEKIDSLYRPYNSVHVYTSFMIQCSATMTLGSLRLSGPRT